MVRERCRLKRRVKVLRGEKNAMEIAKIEEKVAVKKEVEVKVGSDASFSKRHVLWDGYRRSGGGVCACVFVCVCIDGEWRLRETA